MDREKHNESGSADQVADLGDAVAHSFQGGAEAAAGGCVEEVVTGRAATLAPSRLDRCQIG